MSNLSALDPQTDFSLDVLHLAIDSAEIAIWVLSV